MTLTENQEKLLQVWHEMSYYRDLSDKLMKKIKSEGCSHPDPEEYKWQWDDGYGSQHWVYGLRCKFCGAKKDWKELGEWRY